MFKSNWEKTSITHKLPEKILTKMLKLAFPDTKNITHGLIAGGCANLNFKIQLEGESHPKLLRVYLRDKKAASREQKIAELLKKTVLIPTVYFIGELEGYHFAITEFIIGISLRDLLLSHTPHDLEQIMTEIGTLLSKIASYQFPKAGFLDKNLNIIPHQSSDILKFSQNCLKHKTVLSVLSSEEKLAIQKVFDHYDHLLLEMNGHHLVHGDFDPANILVVNLNGTWKVSGILDWEFAFSGSVLWDVANMLRYAHKMPPEFQYAFINSLESSGIKLGDNWQTTIHLLNLSSLLDCLQRSDDKLHPNRCADIRELINHICKAI